MTKYAISFALLATLALAGCKSAEQKAEDLNKEYNALTDQYNADCPEADYTIAHSTMEELNATSTPVCRQPK